MKPCALSLLEIPDRLLQIVALHVDRNDRDLQKLCKLGDRRCQMRIGSDVGISCFRIYDHDIAALDDLHYVLYQVLVVNELTRSKASYLTVDPLAERFESFKLGNVIRAVRL